MDTPKNLKIEYIDIDKLKPYERNARKHEDADVLTIMSSIEHFGFDDPIGIWGKQNLIVEGHGRLLAAKKLGFKEVPCIRLDHLNDEERRAYALAHNKTAEMSAWEREFLDLELDDIDDIDMSEFGFEKEIYSDDFNTDFQLPDGDKPEIVTMTLTLHCKQKAFIEQAISLVNTDLCENFGNTNAVGNRIYEVTKQWAEQRKLKLK